jgi:hypothetical protein
MKKSTATMATIAIWAAGISSSAALTYALNQPRAVVPPLPLHRDISEMRCSDWKPLAAGPVDQAVRYCE